MATVKESSGEQGAVAVEDEDVRGDGKKKKFKPLSAVRKFFGKKRKKEDAVVAVKAQSTTALHSRRQDEDDDEDDGGFKSHSKKPSALAGNRSISEDSVFSPEQREANIQPFPKSAVSEESLPRSAFQSELFTKLNKRKSQYSDDDYDDGLPRSPVPPITTADVIMGGPLKPGTSGTKSSSNRDSDQSLISVGSSENEEEDLFQAKWKSAVPARKSSSGDSEKGFDKKMDPLDFSKIEKTEVLHSSAAKDKILIKPKARKRQSRKKRDSSSPLSLPSLDEESPTRSQPEVISAPEEKVTTSTTATSKPPQVSADNKPSTTTIINSSSSSSTKPNMSSITITSKGDKGVISSTSALPPKVTTAAPLSTKPPSGSAVTVTSVSSGSAVTTAGVSSGSNTISGSTVTVVSSANSSEKMTREQLSSSDRGSEKPKVSASWLSQSERGADETKPAIHIRSRMSQFESPGATAALKVSDPSSSITMSPKEDYKLKRQNRSKTLPGGTDEQGSPKVQRASSHRIHIPPSGSVPQQQQPTSPPSSGSTPATSPPATTAVKKLSDTKFASVDSPTQQANEPSWMNMVRKRKEEAEAARESDSSKKAASPDEGKTVPESPTTKVGPSPPTPKSVFTSAGLFEKKRGSVEAVAFKSQEGADQMKKVDVPSTESTKRPSIDVGSTKRPSIDIGSTKRESIEIDVSQLSSVKALKSSFSASRSDSVTKPSSQADTKKSAPSTSATPSTADRARLFSSPSSTSSSVSVKPAAISRQESDDVGDKVGNSKPLSASGGISHFRGGSVKTSPTHSVQVKAALPTRGGSVKVPSAFSSTSSSSLSSAPSSTTAPAAAATSSVLNNKSDSVSAFKSGSQGSSSAMSSTSSSPARAPGHTTQPNTSLPSHAHLKTESVPGIQSEKVSNRSSKVLDMVKNFQNLQVSS